MRRHPQTISRYSSARSLASVLMDCGHGAWGHGGIGGIGHGVRWRGAHSETLCPFTSRVLNTSSAMENGLYCIVDTVLDLPNNTRLARLVSMLHSSASNRSCRVVVMVSNATKIDCTMFRSSHTTMYSNNPYLRDGSDLACYVLDHIDPHVCRLSVRYS